jgi:hypothetical protein
LLSGLFSIGGGFISTLAKSQTGCTAQMEPSLPYPFDSARSMLRMARESKLSIAEMKHMNELAPFEEALHHGLDAIWCHAFASNRAGDRILRRIDIPRGEKTHN